MSLSGLDAQSCCRALALPPWTLFYARGHRPRRRTRPGGSSDGRGGASPAGGGPPPSPGCPGRRRATAAGRRRTCAGSGGKTATAASARAASPRAFGPGQGERQDDVHRQLPGPPRSDQPRRQTRGAARQVIVIAPEAVARDLKGAGQGRRPRPHRRQQAGQEPPIDVAHQPGEPRPPAAAPGGSGAGPSAPRARRAGWRLEVRGWRLDTASLSCLVIACLVSRSDWARHRSWSAAT